MITEQSRREFYDPTCNDRSDILSWECDMITIWKYAIAITHRQEVFMPRDGKILSVGTQGDTLCLWVEVDTECDVLTGRAIEIIGTGHPMSAIEHRHIGTVQMGPLVWHVFEVPS